MLIPAVRSVYDQRYDDMEIIVVDDGSTDSSAEAIKTLFPAVKLITLPGSGSGPGAARNAGVKVSRGNILMFLDSDDVWLPGHIVELNRILRQNFSVAYGTAKTINLVHGGEFLIPERGDGISGDCFDKLLSWCFLVPSAVAVTRLAFDEVGGFPENAAMGEDWMFFLRLAEYFFFGFAGAAPITRRYLHEQSLCARGSCVTYVHTIRNLKNVYISASRTQQKNILANFSYLEQWIMEKGAQWTTVQQWYSAMKQEGLI